MKHLYKSLSLLLVLAFVFTTYGCGSPATPTATAVPTEVSSVPTEAPTAAPVELPVIRYADLKVYDPVYVAIENGLCKARGVDVQLFGADLGGPTAIQAVSAGSIEAGLSSIPALINANAAGLPVIGVSDLQSAVGDQALEHYFVRSDSGIETIADLKGKNFAVNLFKSSFHYTAFMALEQNGLTADDVNFIILPFKDQAQALDQGSVDVIGLIEPYASQLKATYGDSVRELFNGIDVFGTKQFGLHFVNRIWAENNPDQAAAFVGCIVDAINWIEANQEEAKAIQAKYTKVDVQFVPVYHYQENGMVVMEDIQFWIDYMVGRGDVTVDWLKPESIATNKYQP